MSWDPIWEEVFQKQAWGKYPGEDFIRFIARNFYQIENRKNIKLLEVGCGPGANLWFMCREGFTVYGIDGSKTAIVQAEKRLNQECAGWTGELLVGDMRKLPFADEFFDAVIDNEAIYCNSFMDSQQIYKELSRVTKKKGNLFSRTFASGSWGDETGEKIGHHAWLAAEGPLLNKGYSRFTEMSEIKDLVVGFEVTSVEMITRTMENQKQVIKEWIIIGQKPD